MKNVVILLMLFFALSVKAQTIDYSVDKYYVSHTVDTLDVVEPIDSIQFDTTFTYTLNLIEVSEDGRDTTITKSGGRSAAEIQGELYNKVDKSYNDAATLKVQANDKLSSRTIYLSALNEVGLNDYFTYSRVERRKDMNGNWIVRINGTTYNCTVSNNNGALRTNSSDNSGLSVNTLIGRLVPRSNLFISLALEPAFGEDVEIYSANWSDYISEDLSVRLKYRR